MEFCGSRAKDLAASLRPQGRPVDIDAVAAALDVSVSERAMSRYTLGLTMADGRVFVRAGLASATRRFVLAHEIGHVLVGRGQCPWVHKSIEERFCDSFAAELIAPTDQLNAHDTVETLARAFDVPSAVVAAQRFPGRAADLLTTVGTVERIEVVA